MHPLDTPIWNSLHAGWAALAPDCPSRSRDKGCH